MAVERVTPFLPIDAEVEEIEVILPNEEGEYEEEEDSMEVDVIEFGDNLAEFMDERDLMLLSDELVEGFESDCRSREDWEKTYIKGLDLLGLRFEDRTTPWEGASGVFHPLLTEAVVRFQSQTIQEVFPAKGPAKTSVVGKITDDKLAQAIRVANYMNYLSTKRMVEYRNETEKLLFCLPIAGSAFRKVYFDQTMKRPCAMFVPPEDMVVSYGCSDMSTSERSTHIMRKTENQIRKMQLNGWYRDIELDGPTPDETDIAKKIAKLTGEEEKYEFDGRHTLLEMQVEVDLKGFEDMDDCMCPTGLALPYIITIEKSSGEILGIRRNWKEGDETYATRQYYVHYQYLPGLGFYGFGLVHTIGGLSKAATSILRQLIDSGTLSNLPGGLKTRGLRIKGDNTPIRPGEFRDVDVPAGSISENITFLPYKEPSNVLYQLLGDLVTEGRRFASAADVKASDINGEAPVGTTLAVLEREMKVMSAIQARIHHAMGRELVLLADIIVDYGPEQYPYEAEEEQATVAEDFDEKVDIIPVSDPNAGTMAQRIMQYQAALQLSASAPQMYDMPFLHRQMIEVLGLSEAERIVPTEDDMKPVDPVTENMNLINGKPVKSFMYQDHEAHIEAHMSVSQNPQIQEMLGQHPNAKGLMGAMAAHIAEHVAFAYRDKVEQEMGVQLPHPDEQLPEDIESRLSALVAKASAQVTGKAQKLKKAEEDAEKQEDPILQQAIRELDIKEGAERAKDERERMKIERDAQIKEAELAQKVNADSLKAEAETMKTISAADQAAKDRASKEALRGFEKAVDIVNMNINAKGKDDG